MTNRNPVSTRGAPRDIGNGVHPASPIVSKADVLQSLEEHSLLLPALLNRALAANERAKYFLSLFQACSNPADRAGSATAQTSSLRSERLAAHIDDVDLDRVVER